MNCPWMSHTSSKKKSTMWRVCHRKGPKRGQQQHKTEHCWVQLTMTYQWNKGEEDLIEKKKKLVLLLKHQQPMCCMDKPARQLNHSGMATQGRAGVVDTALESSRLKHWNCIYSSIYICAQNHANKKKKRKKKKRNTSTIYTTTHTTRVACWGHAKKGRM